VADALGTAHSRKGTASREMVVSRPKISFWPDGRTSPGNYWYQLVIKDEIKLIYVVNGEYVRIWKKSVEGYVESYYHRDFRVMWARWEKNHPQSTAFWIVAPRPLKICRNISLLSSGTKNQSLTKQVYKFPVRIPLASQVYYLVYLLIVKNEIINLSEMFYCLRIMLWFNP
jgi:hypothetical protein